MNNSREKQKKPNDHIEQSSTAAKPTDGSAASAAAAGGSGTAAEKVRPPLRKLLGRRLLFFDGGMGTMLQAAGLAGGERPEDWVIEHPEAIRDIHAAYLDAGCDLLTTCTFGANPIKYREGRYPLQRILREAIGLARAAAVEADHDAYIALDLSTTGQLLEPLGYLPFEDAVDAYRQVIRAQQVDGRDLADAVLIETMTDLYELKAAIVAVRECTDLPLFVSAILDERGQLLTGADPAVIAASLEGLGIDVLGFNCGFGPTQMRPHLAALRQQTDLPILAMPNAGLPHMENGQTVYDLDVDTFADEMEEMAALGAAVLGGCCGTTPEHLRELIRRFPERRIRSASASARPAQALRPGGTSHADVRGPLERPDRPAASGSTWAERVMRGAEELEEAAPADARTAAASRPLTGTRITSGTQVVTLGRPLTVIGEKINPTGSKALAQALREDNLDYVAELAVRERDAGAQVLDVNVGLPDLDEVELLPRVIRTVQEVVDLPLVIDCSNPDALEAAARICNGKPLINSVSAKRASLDTVLPIVKKYGAAVIALTLDDDGIPADAAGRTAAARTIIEEAAARGIDRRNIVVDTLAMTVSADQRSAAVTLDAIAMVRKELGVETVLGVSNISFGLPAREKVNTTFFAMALARGLSSAILNPFSRPMMDVVRAGRTLLQQDENCSDYIAYVQSLPAERSSTTAGSTGAAANRAGAAAPEANRSETNTEGAAVSAADGGSALQTAIIDGLREKTRAAVRSLLAEREPMAIINEEIIPALNSVGRRFETGESFLPQLVMSAEAAGIAFAEIKEQIPAAAGRSKGRVLLATVEGDIHDIGKNIVKVLLENYDYDVLDLGRDVPVETVVEAAVREGIKLIGLSALMTTTVPSMARTIERLKEEMPDCRICVGGAVLTEEYAASIGADRYCRDAMATVHVAEEYYE
ncbi:MAG: homocysteine S-methyltransferase family protein [Anaerovoracaceae bacterium]|jgi:5-methyltetrahydrofolate--homocysteine methyltransferase